MKTRQQVTEKASELTATLQEATNKKCTKAQDMAMHFASRIVCGSQAVGLLIDSGAAIEAHTICRLLLEHFFNVDALLRDEKHLDVLQQHSLGEPSRQIKKISQKNEQSATLTAENAKRVKDFLSDPARGNDPKTGLNWEQIASSGQSYCLYVVYKQYSFLYAHSTMASLMVQISEHEIGELYENVWTMLEMVREWLRTKLINAA